ITPFIRPGESNTLTLRVVKWSDASYVEDQDQWWHAGVTRSVFVYTTPRVHIADVCARAALLDDHTTGRLDLQVDVAFDGVEPEAGWTVVANTPDPTLDQPAPVPDARELDHVTGGDRDLIERRAARLPIDPAQTERFERLQQHRSPPVVGQAT